VHNTLARNQRLEPFSLPGVLGVYLLPFVVAGGLTGYGLWDDSVTELAAGSAVLQAVAIAFAYQSLLKAVTGRPPPDEVVYENDDASRRFRFGFFRGGIHYGWPSGHMMTTTAVILSLWRVYPESWALRIGSGLLFAYVAGSVAIHERSSMHWLSDMTAGALMGIAIGSSVGSGFAQHLSVETRASEGLSLTPMLLPGHGIGLAIAGVL
jgi:membrane-associated phospholipid phosphatase